MNKKTFFIIILVSLGLTAILYLYTTPNNDQGKNTSNGEILSYEDCANLPGSVIQESFPPVCVTKDGERVAKPITQEEEDNLIENLDTSKWEDLESELVGIALSYPPNWGTPDITSSSSKDKVEFRNDFTITKGLYYTKQRDRVLTFNEFIERNTPERRIITNYEIDGKDIKRASYDYSSTERAELFVFPPNQNSEMISIFFHYPKSNLEVIREYFGVLSSVEVLPERPLPATPTETTNNSGCIITGCSGEICADEEVVTTCEYKEEYACYESATCEIQADGECGWTMTDELQSCLEETR